MVLVALTTHDAERLLAEPFDLLAVLAVLPEHADIAHAHSTEHAARTEYLMRIPPLVFEPALASSYTT
jgi:hypothetical protein